jgi:hypothetical protein
VCVCRRKREGVCLTGEPHDAVCGRGRSGAAAGYISPDGHRLLVREGGGERREVLRVAEALKDGGLRQRHVRQIHVHRPCGSISSPVEHQLTTCLQCARLQLQLGNATCRKTKSKRFELQRNGTNGVLTPLRVSLTERVEDGVTTHDSPRQLLLGRDDHGQPERQDCL